nr:unnamed protein product [Callosobruchus chinensis]
MITPRFSLSQDENTVTITIRAPYCCLRELEAEVDDNTFLFFCKPYYLRLHLPGNIVDNDNRKSSFDSDALAFSFTYEKAIPGEHFKDLDFITKFLATNVDASYEGDSRKITVLASESTGNESDVDPDDLQLGFGFALQSHKRFVAVSSEFNDVFDIDPSESNLQERRKLRLQYEQGKFDMGHYLGDFIEDDEINEIIAQKTPWCDLNESSVSFNNKELDFLKDLPNIGFTLSNLQTKYAYNGLIDILYAYCYDRRCTFYEENSESGWTIVKLAATFCYLDAFENPRDVLVSAFRRSVIYPLYRNYNLSVQILKDLKELLHLGEKYIVKCLIEIYYIFLGGDCCRYILNNLFIRDYISYIMTWDREKWQSFLKEIYAIEIRKEELGLNLSEIEQGFTLEEKLGKLEIKDTDSDDSSDDSSDESDSDSSDTDSSDSSSTLNG